MKNMTHAQEFLQAPPPGRYLSRISAAEATVSKKSGASMLKLTCTIIDERYAGMEADDYIITDGTAKGAGLGRKKLRALGTPLINRAIDTDEEIPDAAIAQELVGLQLFVEYGNEQRMGRRDPNDQNSPFDRPMTIFDEKLGKEVPLNKLTVVGYSRSAVQTQPQAQAQPVAPPAQFMPQQFSPQPTQQFAPPPAQPFAQNPAVQAVPWQQPAAPAPQPGFVPAGYVPPGQMAMAFPQVAQPVWNGGQPAPAPAPAPAPVPGSEAVDAAEADKGKGKKRGRAIVDG